MNPAISISASQIETFRLCKRKWAFNKIDRIPAAQNSSAALGEEAHKHRENWLLNGTPPPADTKAGKLALVGLEHLPPPGIALVEQPLDFRYPLDDKIVRVTGRIDFLIPNQDPARLWGEPGVPVVGDHKTTAGEIWAKTPEALLGGDAQAAIYSAFALATFNASSVDLHWSYMIKGSSPKEKQVRARMTRAQTEEQFGKVLDDAKGMLQIVGQDGISAVQVEPNAHACEAFGGCAYREICPLSQTEKVGALMTQSSLEAMLKMALNGSAPAATPPIFGGAPDPSTTPAQAASVLPAVPLTLVGAPPAAAPIPPAAPSLPPASSVFSLAGLGITPAAAPAPVPAAPAPVPAAPAPAFDLAALTSSVSTSAPAAGAVSSTAPVALSIVPPDAPAADQNATEPEEKKKRGRPKKAATSTDDGDEGLYERMDRLTAAIEKLAAALAAKV
ncbi:MAG: hypothetical protein EBT03_09690 [Betaproteobacteria bacterium]|nr:hypothetical protein [Betaproteobacteria bacterium]NCA17143.1 hypothetical protein [Betaproteobacteria bacterium]